jgi:hypothetical protein
MAMSTGAKVAIGCTVAFVVAVMGTVFVIFGAAWWGLGKAKQMTRELAGQQEKIDRLRSDANRNTFTPPADGVIQEAQLLRFLGVRKRIFAVYEANRADIEAFTSDQKKPGGLEALKAMRALNNIINGLRLARAEGLADQHMSEEEYGYLVASVYRTIWTAAAEKGTGQPMSKLAEQAAERSADEADKAAEQPELPEESRKALRETARQMREQAEQARKLAKDMDAPPANIALFRKYEAEIAKYSMAGLEFAGL